MSGYANSRYSNENATFDRNLKLWETNCVISEMHTET